MSTASSLFHVSGSALGRDLYDKAIKKGLGGVMSSRDKDRDVGCDRRYSPLVPVPPGRGCIPLHLRLWSSCSNLPRVVCCDSLLETGHLAWRDCQHGRWAWSYGGVVRLRVYKNRASDHWYKSCPPLSQLDPLFVGIPVSLILLVIVTLRTKKPPEEQIERAFRGIS